MIIECVLFELKTICFAYLLTQLEFIFFESQKTTCTWYRIVLNRIKPLFVAASKVLDIYEHVTRLTELLIQMG